MRRPARKTGRPTRPGCTCVPHYGPQTGCISGIQGAARVPAAGWDRLCADRLARTAGPLLQMQAHTALQQHAGSPQGDAIPRRSHKCHLPVEGAEHVRRVGVAVRGLARDQVWPRPARVLVERKRHEAARQRRLQPAQHLRAGAGRWRPRGRTGDAAPVPRCSPACPGRLRRTRGRGPSRTRHCDGGCTESAPWQPGRDRCRAPRWAAAHHLGQEEQPAADGAAECGVERADEHEPGQRAAQPRGQPHCQARADAVRDQEHGAVPLRARRAPAQRPPRAPAAGRAAAGAGPCTAATASAELGGLAGPTCTGCATGTVGTAARLAIALVHGLQVCVELARRIRGILARLGAAAAPVRVVRDRGHPGALQRAHLLAELAQARARSARAPRRRARTRHQDVPDAESGGLETWSAGQGRQQRRCDAALRHSRGRTCRAFAHDPCTSSATASSAASSPSPAAGCAATQSERPRRTSSTRPSITPALGRRCGRQAL